MTSTVLWLNHAFGVFPAAARWNPIAGVYIFAGVSPSNHWVALYIGQAASLASRLPGHERWAEAQRLGATHVHALVVTHQTDRDLLERSLIRAYQPHLNQQLRYRSLA